VEGARYATPDDLDAIVALADRAAAVVQEQRGGWLFLRHDAHPAPYGRSLGAAIADAACVVVVGTLDEVVVGFGVGHLEALHTGESLGVVTELFVEPEARAVGVGEAVMDRLVSWFEARECVGVDAVALPGDRDTKNFFETFGLVARAIVVHRPIRR
jgi:GNAT superfamily N-acetyltransferase